VKKSSIIICLLSLITSIKAGAQTPVWVNKIGGTGADISQMCAVAPNGNVYVGGKFTGSMDLDPGPGVTTVTSAGNDDMFLACYNANGTFLWGYNIGGAGIDAILKITTDLNSNVLITGWFNGPSVDFDPGPGVAAVSGICCGSVATTGNGFIAKYSPTGAYQWAKKLGGPLVYNYSQGVTTDGAGNIYVGGVFRTSMIVSPSITLYESSQGTAYVVKYAPDGTVIWAHNFGGGTDGQTRAIRVVGDRLYLCGFYSYTADFYPWGSHYYLTASGYGDMFVARWDTAGNFKWVRGITGSGGDDCNALILDAAENIYLTGYARSPVMTFNSTTGSTAITSPGGGGSIGDIMLGKYDSAGNFIWGKLIGGTGDDFGLGIDIVNGQLYNSGYFQNTVDFDPSPATANLASNGNYDIFMTKYDLDGNYICGFNVGSTGEDRGYYGLGHDDSGYMYISGWFSGTNTDFDPGTGSYLRTSSGGTDAFLAKYDWSGSGTIAGYLTGDTICGSNPAYLTLHITAGGTGPFSLSISNGTSSSVYSGIMDGVPFPVSPTPGTTTTYTIVSAGSAAGLCNSSTISITGATVFVSAGPSVHIGNDTSICGSATVSFSAPTGSGYSYSWSTGATGSSISVSSPGSYWVTITNTSGCVSSDTVEVIFTPYPTVNLGSDTANCVGIPISLATSGAYASPSYLWSTGSSAPSINVSTPGNYWLQVTVAGCSGSDTVHADFFPPVYANLGNDTVICKLNGSVVLTSAQTEGVYSTWSTGSTTDTIHVATAGNYWVEVDNHGCKTTDSIYINIVDSPYAIPYIKPDLCVNDTTTLRIADESGNIEHYFWNQGGATVLNTSVTDTAGPFTVKWTDSGTYIISLSVTTPEGCKSDTAYDTVHVHPLPVAGIIDTNHVTCANDEIILRASVTDPGYFYTWLPSAFFDDSYAAVVTGHVLYSADVTLIVSTSFGCKAETFVTLQADSCCLLTMPAGFTPNNDGHNDLFRPITKQNVVIEQFRIFNRWGNCVFESNGDNAAWDGTYKGEKQDMNVFYYYIKYTCSGAKRMQKGEVTLVR
jgi:gliding motility-associated-like protein